MVGVTAEGINHHILQNAEITLNARIDVLVH